MAEQDLNEQSLSELLQRLSDQTTTLVRQEIKLAQAELQEKGKRAGIGAGLFGAGGLVALYGVGALVAAAVLALATAVDAWVAALIVGGALLLVAGAMALLGKREVEQATPPIPEQAIETSRRDVEEIKERAGRR